MCEFNLLLFVRVSNISRNVDCLDVLCRVSFRQFGAGEYLVVGVGVGGEFRTLGHVTLATILDWHLLRLNTSYPRIFLTNK